MDAERHPIPQAAVAGLHGRHIAHEATERDLTTYLQGILAGLDIDPKRYAGFDDQTGELLLKDPPDDETVREGRT